MLEMLFVLWTKKDIIKDNGVNYRRQAGVNFTKFIIEFNQKYNEVKQHKMELVDGVLGYFDYG